ncbi:cellulose synthase/poly-beta-1,6-N-acetylglucosamine synthase-like glycosyltransferase [Arcicella aurantiaca]|uniref:Cellulose synthase/poly-beta-1,6-N-acetylglucosamine synthase-like glycosyltransferase n=1 Tax=Arcicella aurantiaca TaxID=591202 RepID=A0A316E824_9BACT|nr:glycosyltransferase [Arcicella aurantiaca]PWK26614.1 cellulose synthase/poly-beta-1,6-N-acetylglucosamine synthase-like glycosyltransferase [Arcicella aurantiaca]
MNYPKITIWIAARNEEDNIINCLQSIERLDYPKDCLQVLIGNDNSDDNTKWFVVDFIKNKRYFQLVDIQKVINSQRGKANVLANLYEHSTGEYFLICDADVTVNPNWVKGMIANFEKDAHVGHQVGITSIRGKKIWHQFQSIDWLHALTLLKIAADLKIPLTGLGNNSAITRKAYESTGGYAKIPFSITEDFALFHEVVKKGFGFKNTINQEVFNQTLPMFNLREFLHQRKRWMVGALQCPWWVVGLLFFQALFLPILLIIGLTFSWKIAGILWFLKWLNQTITVLPTIIKLKEYHLIKHLLLYEFYANWWQITMIFFYYSPVKVDWKGRVY